MKTLLLATTAVALFAMWLGASPALSAVSDPMLIAKPDFSDSYDRRGRGRGGRSHDDRRSNDDSGRSKPRVPGGSGCDSASDVGKPRC